MRRFLFGLVVIAALAGAQTIAQAPQGQMTQAQIEEFRQGALPIGTKGLTLPAVLRESKPVYTSQAMKEKIQGSVNLEIIVNSDGTVTKARVLKSLDTLYGLDQAAIDSAKQWRFKPGMLDGKPVAVIMQLELEFRLHAPLEDFRQGAYEPGHPCW